jgi:8-amino-7-oxononanoate synthase
VDLNAEIEQRKEQGLFRKREVLKSAQGPLININGEQFLNFSSNDYLGFANNESLKKCMIESIDEFGIGAGSSQLIVGHSSPHNLLEKRLAKFLNRDAALVFPTGYQANLAVASTLIDSDTVVLQDKLNHASLIDAALLSKGKLVRYRHKDMLHLESLLEKYKHHRLIIMTDGVFSMDGDFALLSELSDLSKQYSATLIVDDAHGIGVLGESGAGLLELIGLKQNQVHILIGTFGKSFGASGAFVSGEKLLVEMFVQKARTYIYTTALLPAIAATMVQAIDMIVEGNSLRKNIYKLIGHYKNRLSEAGLDRTESVSQIQPLIIGEATKAVGVSKVLYDQKIMVSAIRPPTVPKNTSRLRVSICATHTKDQVDRLVNSIGNALVKL